MIPSNIKPQCWLRGSISALLVLTGTALHAQQTQTLTLNSAIKLGLENSKVLKLSQARIDEAVSRYNQTKDNVLPKASASLAYNHAEIPTNTFTIGTGNPLHLPSRADAYIGTLSVQEVIFAGNKLRYAKESTEMLTKVARLDAEKDKDDIVYAIINAYYTLYRIDQSQKVIKQNLEAVDSQVKQSQRFFDQGIVTKNDVLRFQLQRSNVELTGIDLENNRKIVNYNLDVLLGLPENTIVQIPEFKYPGEQTATAATYLDSAATNRTEIKEYGIRTQLAENNIKNINADRLPTLGVGLSSYFINPSGKFIPKANTYLFPVTLGATLSWNFDRLWMNKNKLAEARIQRTEAEIGKTISLDQVKTEVNQNYQNYLTALKRISVYEASIAQAVENDKILESKYKNNIASATDRIDAETQLFQTKINLELAKADAALAYYALLKSTGSITNIN